MAFSANNRILRADNMMKSDKKLLDNMMLSDKSLIDGMVLL
jgi:hypothetical protein